MAASSRFSLECIRMQCSLNSSQEALCCSNALYSHIQFQYLASQRKLSFASSHKPRGGTPCVRSEINPITSQGALPNKNPGSAETSSNISGTRLSRIALTFWRNLADKVGKARRRAPLKLLSLLLGYYSANALSTLIGQTGDWDVLAVGIAVSLVEAIGFLTYRLPSVLHKFQEIICMANYWKLGLSLGFILDKFKLEMELPYDACNIFLQLPIFVWNVYIYGL